jgi:hypothetical protein
VGRGLGQKLEQAESKGEKERKRKRLFLLRKGFLTTFPKQFSHYFEFKI